MSETSLKAKTLSGMIWSFIQRFGTMLISFVSNIVLARLLTPNDYGVIGMLMIFIAVANTFVDGGFGSALIQKKDPTKEDYSTIFWWNMFLSIVLYGVLFLCAPAVARFYDLPLLAQVLRVQGLVLILNALSIIQQNQLRKQLKFKRLASVTVVSALLSASIAIYLAFKGWGVWALVAQQLMMSGFNALLLWIINKWYPNFIFSKQSFKQLFGFGGYILSSNLINTLCNNLQGLLIGKFFSPATMGYYSQAQKLESVASHSISGVVEQVAYPILSQVQHNNNSMKRVVNQLITSLAYLTIPLMFILILVAEPLFMFLYGEIWLSSVPYFQILCVSGMAFSLQNITYYAVASKGKSKDLFIWTIIKRIVTLIILISGFVLGGVWGLLWGVSIGSWAVLAMNSYLVSKHIGYKLIHQMMDLAPIVMVASISFIFSKLFGILCNIDSNILQLVILIVGYLLIYISLSLLLKLKPLRFIGDNVKSFAKGFRF